MKSFESRLAQAPAHRQRSAAVVWLVQGLRTKNKILQNFCSPAYWTVNLVMEANITLVFHGFLNLTAKEKLKLIEEINNYFDSNDREPIRAGNEAEFTKLDLNSDGKSCKCCGR